MGELYERIIQLCKERGITGTKLCRDIEIQPSIMTDLKMGRQSGLSAKNAQKVASYFGVSVAYLLGEKENAPAGREDELLQKLRDSSATRALLHTLIREGLTENEINAYRFSPSR